MQRTNIACSGGSSSVLRSALNASVVSMCTSSIIYTFFCADTGRSLIFSRKSRISSIPLFDAPSISKTSKFVPSVIEIQESHSLQGILFLNLSSLLFTLCSQLTYFATIRAVDRECMGAGTNARCRPMHRADVSRDESTGVARPARCDRWLCRTATRT